ncbi:hypothetical protein SLA2020_354790 [Shorea laevis]
MMQARECFILEFSTEILIDTNFAWSLDKFEYMESLLMWHIATEICDHLGGPDNSPSTSTSTSRSFGYQ